MIVVGALPFQTLVLHTGVNIPIRSSSFILLAIVPLTRSSCNQYVPHIHFIHHWRFQRKINVSLFSQN
ncbi:hypothetical protein FisN_7Hu281 [Fistulifera solaris]|uniref:Uncharacterized protein n=1 Tax=Fistulifera solaris TaxID=1519565 RepID=A0A1Z5KT04_FISSO|nr:hypothetical protein FisN_7Hu281 [Fistulifera solaris]|eukprot:GAX29121.1 hypothetical protein FisN_7Hu281 [Fistulifera solaris]